MARKKKKNYRPCDGPWLDVGVGVCAHCQAERRLYRPVEEPKTEGVCAPCTQMRVCGAIL